MEELPHPSEITIDEILQYWTHAGERPFEYMIELGYDKILLHELSRSFISLSDGALYRGSRRNNELQIGDIKNYDYPSSWSDSITVAESFTHECANQVIFILQGDKTIHAISNQGSFFDDEKETIVAPIILRIIGREEKDGIIFLECEPV